MNVFGLRRLEMNDKIVVRIDSEEDIETFKTIAESNGWECGFITRNMLKPLTPKEEPMCFNISSLPSLGWDYISYYESQNFDIITIQEALDMFNVWIPKKGETVLAKFLAKFDYVWEPVVFIAEYDGRYVCKDNLDLYFFDEIKEYPVYYKSRLVTYYKTGTETFELSLTEEQVQQTIEFMKGLKEHDQ